MCACVCTCVHQEKIQSNSWLLTIFHVMMLTDDYFLSFILFVICLLSETSVKKQIIINKMPIQFALLLMALTTYPPVIYFLKWTFFLQLFTSFPSIFHQADSSLF